MSMICIVITVCGSSDTDSVIVTVDCGTISADIKANGSDADIMTYEDYTISWTSSDADDCTLNGGVVALSGSQDESATTEGDYTYNLSCDNFCGDTASDEVTVTVGFCGDGVCSGFETCVDCEADCGECPNAWWQVWGGSLLSGATGSTAINSPVPGDRSEFVLLSVDDKIEENPPQKRSNHEKQTIPFSHPLIHHILHRLRDTTDILNRDKCPVGYPDLPAHGDHAANRYHNANRQFNPNLGANRNSRTNPHLRKHR